MPSPKEETRRRVMQMSKELRRARQDAIVDGNVVGCKAENARSLTVNLDMLRKDPQFIL